MLVMISSNLRRKLMISIGLTGFTDHPEITGKGGGLAEYAQNFPIVEIDTTAYGIRKRSVFADWRAQVPANFRFIVKATRLMTRHQHVNEATLIQEFALFADSIEPLVVAGQLEQVLFQFPPRFGANARNARYLAHLRKLLPTLPLGVELRNSSWFAPSMKASTLELLADAHITNFAVDEPQVPGGSIPFVPVPAYGDTLYVRLHGRNRQGWISGAREVRTDYDYSDEQLREIATACAGRAENICYIFNNNAGHAAAPNALRMQEILGVQFAGLAPKQLDLF
ncbi:DUF72 domain-containing protein [Lacticaseibacillus songhuajiangensis]|jgi:uncharacterized protein YecE (DUF72 family)|uniref:DUF72 domain-containing protein n=1 Tax=Lacticaseibacillus songhuajiangensis TaxID=1296539 RepID=UPI000F7B02F0|nr:DUF72 domain-containing protein [Lacticaseibacillus songhuajiangensis]